MSDLNTVLIRARNEIGHRRTLKEQPIQSKRKVLLRDFTVKKKLTPKELKNIGFVNDGRKGTILMRLSVKPETTHLYIKITIQKEPIPSNAKFFYVPCLPVELRKAIMDRISRMSILECRAFSLTNKEMYKLLEPFLIKNNNPLYDIKHEERMKICVVYPRK